MKIRKLEGEFTKRGAKYTQLVKSEIFVIYRCENEEYNDLYFEVFKYRTAKPHPMDTGDWDEVEVYPSNESFGVTAWECICFESIEKVMKKHFGIDDVEWIRPMIH